MRIGCKPIARALERSAFVSSKMIRKKCEIRPHTRESVNNALLFCLFFLQNCSHERRFFLVGAFFWAPPFVVFANQHASHHERVRGLDLARSWIDPDSVQLARLACWNPHASLIDARIEPWCRHGATVRSAAPRRICEANRRGNN